MASRDRGCVERRAGLRSQNEDMDMHRKDARSMGRVREATVMAGGSGDSGNGLKATRSGSGGDGDVETGGQSGSTYAHGEIDAKMITTMAMEIGDGEIKHQAANRYETHQTQTKVDFCRCVYLQLSACVMRKSTPCRALIR